jgi:hypothetical protein
MYEAHMDNQNLPFVLYENEVIEGNFKPEKAIVKELFLPRIIPGAMMTIFFLILMTEPDVQTASRLLGLCLVALGIGITGGGYIVSKGAYEQCEYWLTNQRLIVKWGITGYWIDCIPLNKIKGASVARLVSDRVFGLSSIKLETDFWTLRMPTRLEDNKVILDSLLEGIRIIGIDFSSAPLLIRAQTPENAAEIQKKVSEALSKAL